jgi:hypothetical protein
VSEGGQVTHYPTLADRGRRRRSHFPRLRLPVLSPSFLLTARRHGGCLLFLLARIASATAGQKASQLTSTKAPAARGAACFTPSAEPVLDRQAEPNDFVFRKRASAAPSCARTLVTIASPRTAVWLRVRRRTCERNRRLPLESGRASDVPQIRGADVGVAVRWMLSSTGTARTEDTATA